MLESDAVLERALRLKAAGTPFALVTVVRCESPTSAKPGAKAVVEADGLIQGWIGGGCAQPAVIKVVKTALQDGQPRLIRISPSQEETIEPGIMDFGMTCHSGGTLDIFIDPVIPRPALLIIGAAPAAQALCVLASRVGFAVTVAFPGATQEIFPDASRIIDGFEVADFSGAPRRFVVVATQGKRDEPGLEAALVTGSDYIAFIASERKADKLRQYLKERGHDAARVDSIIAPAGIEIGAVTPEEIALSVLAGLVQAWRGTAAGTQPRQASQTVVAAPMPATAACCGGAAAAAAEAIDPVCGMTVATAGAEQRFEYAGTTYYFCCAHCQHAFQKEPQKYLAVDPVTGLATGAR